MYKPGDPTVSNCTKIPCMTFLCLHSAPLLKSHSNKLALVTFSMVVSEYARGTTTSACPVFVIVVTNSSGFLYRFPLSSKMSHGQGYPSLAKHTCTSPRYDGVCDGHLSWAVAIWATVREILGTYINSTQMLPRPTPPPISSCVHLRHWQHT